MPETVGVSESGGGRVPGAERRVLYYAMIYYTIPYYNTLYYDIT